jgi:hypothetical protein
MRGFVLGLLLGLVAGYALAWLTFVTLASG